MVHFTFIHLIDEINAVLIKIKLCYIPNKTMFYITIYFAAKRIITLYVYYKKGMNGYRILELDTEASPSPLFLSHNSIL